MNYRKYIVGSVVVLATMLFSLQGFALDLKSTRATQPWHVTEVKQEGVSLCDKGGAQTWNFKISWKAIIHDNKQWQQYIVGGYKCAGSSKVTCAAGRCSAVVSGCLLSAYKTWVGITADVGSRTSGIRATGLSSPPSCK